jgi:hypothetical protein
MVEAYFWVFVSLVVAGRVIFIVLTTPPEYTREIFREYYWDFALAAVVFIFPLMFKLIFGALPLEHLRIRRVESRLVLPEPSLSKIPETEQKRVDVGASATSVNAEFSLLLEYAAQARQLARGIYGRAGVYLLVGVLVAFSGLVFFYAQTPPEVAASDAYRTLLTLAPKFGILFFIEFVAFFFLKQYRSAMDEFRYYDAIARVREEVLTLLQISASSGKPVSPLDLVKYDAYFSRAGVLAKGQTTELIEARRLEGSELETVQKALEILAKQRK